MKPKPDRASKALMRLQEGFAGRSLFGGETFDEPDGILIGSLEIRVSNHRQQRSKLAKHQRFSIRLLFKPA